MADATALYSLISGIGGALIGGVAGVYGPGMIDRRRRQHEWAVERERRRHELELDEQRRELDAAAGSLTAIAEASTCLHGWLRLVEWSLQDLDAGRSLDVARYDEQAEQALQAVTRAISVLSNNKFRADWRSEGGSGRPVMRLMHEIAAELRRQIVAPRPGFDSAAILTRATDVRDVLTRFLTAERRALTGQSLVIMEVASSGRATINQVGTNLYNYGHEG